MQVQRRRLLKSLHTSTKRITSMLIEAKLVSRSIGVMTHNVGTDWAKTALPIPHEIDFTANPDGLDEPSCFGLLYPLIMAHVNGYNQANEADSDRRTMEQN